MPMKIYIAFYCILNIKTWQHWKWTILLEKNYIETKIKSGCRPVWLMNDLQSDAKLVWCKWWWSARLLNKHSWKMSLRSLPLSSLNGISVAPPWSAGYKWAHPFGESPQRRQVLRQDGDYRTPNHLVALLGDTTGGLIRSDRCVLTMAMDVP